MPLVESARLPKELDRPELALSHIVAYATFDVSPRIALAVLSQGLLSVLPGFLLGLPWVFCWVVAGRLNGGNLVLVLCTPLAFEFLIVLLWLFRAWQRWRRLQASAIVVTDSEMVYYQGSSWRSSGPFASIPLKQIEDAHIEQRRVGCLHIPKLMIDRSDTKQHGSLAYALQDLESLRRIVLRERDAARQRSSERARKQDEALQEALCEQRFPSTPSTGSGTFFGDFRSESSGTSFRIPIDIVDDAVLADLAIEQPADDDASICQSFPEEDEQEV